MGVDRIATPKVASSVRAGVSLIWTQPPVAMTEVSVPVAPNLLDLRMPVPTLLHSTIVSHLAIQIRNRPEIVVVDIPRLWSEVRLGDLARHLDQNVMG